MNQHKLDSAAADDDDALGGPLGDAVAFIRAQPAPPEAMRRTVATAAAWGEAPPPGVFRVVGWGRAAAVACLAACVVLGVVTYRALPRRPVVVIGGNPTEPPAAASQPADMTFYQPMPLTQAAVAEGAPVLITFGPDEPMALGARVPHGLLRGGAGMRESRRAHVWDWSRSRTSRLAWVPASGYGMGSAALSPDGMRLLCPDGEMVDLSTNETRHFGGFETGAGQRVERLRFSPDGKLVAALVSDAGPDGRVVGRSVRLVRLSGGRAEAPQAGVNPLGAGTPRVEFEADDVDWFAWAAFAPDGESLTYADPDNVVTRRSVRTGVVLGRYEPALEPHGAVGIAVSPDGRLTAAGHYHGELFVWETASAKLVLRSPFLRADGDPDRFWQAKVLAFSPDGDLLATASGNRLQLVEARTGRVVARDDTALPAGVVHLRWSRDRHTITAVLGSTVVTQPREPGFAPRPSADVLPRVYEWAWESGNPPAELAK